MSAKSAAVAVLLVVVLAFVACQSEEARIASHAERADAYFESQDWSAARIEYLNWVRLDPSNARARYRLAEVELALLAEGDGDATEVRTQLREAVRLAPDNVEYRERLGVLEIAWRQPQEALEHARVLIERDPASADAWTMQAQAKGLLGDTAGQIEGLERAAELAPERAAIALLLAQAYARGERPEEAERSFRRALEVDPSARAHSALAAFLIDQGRPAEAVPLLETAVEAANGEPERLEARTRLANLHVLLGRLDAAESVMRNALAARPDDVELMGRLARFYVLRGQPEQALAMLEQQAERRPDEPEPHITLARFHERLQQLPEALAALERALEIDPASDEALALQAQLLLAQAPGDTAVRERARAILAEVLERDPASRHGLFAQAKLLLSEGRTQEAADHLERVVAREASANALYLLGTAYARLGRDDAARDALRRALEIEPERTALRSELAAVQLRTGRFEQAAREAEAVLERTPSDARARLIAAEALLRAGRETAARGHLEALDLDAPGVSAAIRVGAADLLWQLGASRRARQLVERVLEDAPADLSALRLSVVLAGDDVVSVLPRLDAAIAARPEDAALYALRGAARLGVRRSGAPTLADEAERDLRRALDLDPEVSGPRLRLAQLYREQGRIDRALESYREARAHAPRSAEIRVEMGTLYEQLGLGDEAEELYREALELDASLAVAKNNLAWCLVTRDGATPSDLDRALALAQEAKAQAPGVPAFADTLGYAMLAKGRPLAAVALFKEAIAGFGPGAERAAARVHLGWAYEREGDLAAAERELRLAADESAGVAVELGRFLERVGRSSDAVRAYGAALRAWPLESLESLHALADLHRREGRPDQAARAYRESLPLLERAVESRAPAPERARVRLELARVYHALDQKERAREQLDRSLAEASHYRGRSDALALRAELTP